MSFRVEVFEMVSIIHIYTRVHFFQMIVNLFSFIIPLIFSWYYSGDVNFPIFQIVDFLQVQQLIYRIFLHPFQNLIH